MKRLFWLDLEMTGLEVETHKILEVAAIVTDIEFKNLGQFHRVVKQPQAVLDLMDDWCRKTHGDSGLTEAVKTKGVALSQVEKDLVDFANQFYTLDEKIVLVGNSINQDKMFIDAQMKDFSKRLHYRIIDVSSFKEIYKWKFGIAYKKDNSHRAITDIEESIDELRTYCSYIGPKPYVHSDGDSESDNG